MLGEQYKFLKWRPLVDLKESKMVDTGNHFDHRLYSHKMAQNQPLDLHAKRHVDRKQNGV